MAPADGDTGHLEGGATVAQAGAEDVMGRRADQDLPGGPSRDEQPDAPVAPGISSGGCGQMAAATSIC